MSALADSVLRITRKYLGPAARVFLERQTKYHMDGLAFADIRPNDLPTLIYWVRVSSELIIKKKSQLLVAELMEDLHVPAIEK